MVDTSVMAVSKDISSGENGPKKAKRWLIVAAGVLVCLGLLGAYGLPKVLHRAAALKANAAHPGPVLAFPQETLNLADGYLLQVTVAVQETTAANAKQVSKLEPELLNSEISILGHFTYYQLLSAGGKSTARAELLAGFEKVLGTTNGEPQVMAVYFTSFVMQQA
ncbi:MAG: flagellar basal body-associated FliL family protein [Actinobacteria bacterium]|nr:flagellar basal body-associated FliL family protein [Actinomycetota bacterium]